ncbi:MAG: zinc ABC transporter substrate-binding protein [bacterium]|nr:zinc ABC transporter substrate-binding protein [bacterium]
MKLKLAAIFTFLTILIPIGLCQAESTKLKICATTPDLASILNHLSTDAFDITVFANGEEDPHFVQPKPSYIKHLYETDIIVFNGLELETGWLPPLLERSRNSRIIPGSLGYIDASKAISAMDVPTIPVDRSMGDVHPQGNPHYMLDPLNGLAVARLLKQRISELKPALTASLEENYEKFKKEITKKLYGTEISDETVISQILHDNTDTEKLLKSHKITITSNSWQGQLSSTQPLLFIADHNMWPYMARRFSFEVASFLEPRPGITPTSSHLQTLVELCKSKPILALIIGAYYDPRHADLMHRSSNIPIIRLAHQVGALPGTDDYLQMFDYNLQRLSEITNAAYRMELK